MRHPRENDCMSAEASLTTRRNDLDALRAAAMSLGILLHAALSFFPSLWVVSDSRQLPSLAIVVSAIHGFRMPLFFVMSGYFSAMLLARRGRRALLKHRFFRVFLPLVLAMVTITPATNVISGLALSSTCQRADAREVESGADVWRAARSGALTEIPKLLSAGADVNAPDPKFGAAPLTWAALGDRAEAITLLIRRGAKPDQKNPDGGTALHAAAFLGNQRAVEALVENRANANLANTRGQTALDLAIVDEPTTIYFAAALGLDVEKVGLGKRKGAIAEYLRSHGAVVGKSSGIGSLLVQTPVFGHLWFLWYLWWLVLGFAAVTAIASVVRLPATWLPARLVISPAHYLWLIPLTMIPQAFMGDAGHSPSFGPDTSTGLLPMPHVFAYYAIFFGFGAIYFGYDDSTGRISNHWRLALAIGLLVIFPLAMAFSIGMPGVKVPSIPFDLSPRVRQPLSVFLQSAYAWLMAFGLMGLFRHLFSTENAKIRYLSDSAYWLYLAHMPLIIAAQYAVRDWPIPAVFKFLGIVIVVTGALLISYETLVRHTWLGRLLNGRRARPPKVDAAASAGCPG
jgi:surface polysaccharide O-acyltransferase-like enzyme